VTEYLEPEQAVSAASHLGFYIRDEGLLFSALARPATSVFGNDAYATIELKAAALLSSVARNHALIDGNKRFSWYLALAFFKLNGFRVVMTNDAAFDLVLAVAQGSLELSDIAAVFAAHIVTDSAER
jgi:death on curing protein